MSFVNNFFFFLSGELKIINLFIKKIEFFLRWI